MRKPVPILVPIGVLLLVAAGCSDAGPRQPGKFVAQESAAPMPVAQKAAETPIAESKPQEVEAVSQAAFQELAAVVPPVLLTQQHAALCRVKVGDTLPEITLPQVSGGTAKLSAMYGKAATVIVFWKSDRAMSIQELKDLGPDVVQPFGSRDVAVVGIAVDETAASARDVIKKTAANFPQLLDADGQAFAKVGAKRLPWTLVLDPAGKIVWFDIEYSLTTRRELQQSLLALVK